ncbi:lipase 3-like [Chelonus insularis]|uniref:lipase 3-like n=1 Tax=Chelonus insularis TaxID=460826 RepID=UPI00158A24BD|nr:lipase 3-like [Chelonus insularis]
MKHISLFILVCIFPVNVLCLGFLRELLFPRNPVLHRSSHYDRTRTTDDDTVLDFIGLVEKHGYPAEEHHLTTEDGYKLTFHRIPGSPKSPPRSGKPIVFCQHGLLGSSDYWVLLGPNKDLAFILADEGYDIWLSNVRGNTYCRSHEELSPTSSQFWSFSYHEIALYDLPAMIDYALNVTNEKMLYYIGHSMGTTMSYVLLSTKLDYNDKIRLAINLAPVAFWKSLPKDNPYYALIENYSEIKRFFENNQIYDLFALTTNSARIGKGLCSDNMITQQACIALIFHFSGASPKQLNSTLLPHILSYVPAGASVQTVEHYGQNMKFKSFTQYDYGYPLNFKIYGKKKPPIYDVKKITAKIAILYSENDPLVIEENVQELVKKLQNLVFKRKVPFKSFNHLDFIWAKDAKYLVYDTIIDLLSQY